MKVFIRFLLISIILLSFAGTFFYLYQKSQESPVHYKTKTAVIRDIIKKTVATGSVVPRKEIAIKPQISGIVEEVFVEAGTMVKKGDLIVRVRIIPDMIALNSAESRLNQADIAYENTRKAYQRKKELYRKALISEELFEEIEFAFKKAKEERTTAKNHLQLIKEGFIKKSGESTNTLIRSTIDGMVLDVPVKQGHSLIESNNFNEGTTVAIVADMDEMIFEGKIDESEVGKLQEGMDLILSIGAIEDETFHAKIEYIAPKGEIINGAVQFNIRAKIELKDSHFVRAGYSANADIVLAQRQQVLAIEESLLQFKGEQPFVEVETQPQQFEKRMIKLGLSDGIYAEVLEGVTKEDRIKIQQ
ncbi:MAG: efflux RND transporter periplasmic adaptor subunit [SAR324 cluster bacterium]|nr:efflux RND transporter periplasmic adaptor subunit [SAR324 cluster bacterium]